MSAHVAIVGAGSGAADLITVRGLRYLQQADCILHDALVGQELLALAPAAVKIAVGKRCGQLSTAQQFINQQLVDAAKKYQRVVRLKGGDPMVFGRTDEEMLALRAAGIVFEVVPGVTAALAAAASLQTSLTLRGVARSVALVTPMVGQGHHAFDMATKVSGVDTLAVYMGLKQAPRWAQGMLCSGAVPTTPVLVCESISMPSQQIRALTLAQLADFDSLLSAPLNSLSHDGPCLILIGQAMARYQSPS